ncbi:hypothetical protein LN650_23555 [Klebsiella pneumoniae subsp. pneumoniae]|nr:hypothetical protein [Klebsiella pneumoniae subsp. pneumoniae]
MASYPARLAGRTDGCLVLRYHFAILFEALFILTAVDAGTRGARFRAAQDLAGRDCARGLKKPGSLLAQPAGGDRAAMRRAGVGLLPASGVVDPLGGINTLWPLFGIANQMCWRGWR